MQMQTASGNKNFKTTHANNTHTPILELAKLLVLSAVHSILTPRLGSLYVGRRDRPKRIKLLTFVLFDFDLAVIYSSLQQIFVAVKNTGQKDRLRHSELVPRSFRPLDLRPSLIFFCYFVSSYDIVR